MEYNSPNAIGSKIIKNTIATNINRLIKTNSISQNVASCAKARGCGLISVKMKMKVEMHNQE